MAINNSFNNDLTNCLNLPVPGGLSATGTPSSTTFLRGDGAWASVAAVGSLKNVQVLTSGSNYVRSAGVTSILVLLLGGGGAGGGSQGAASTFAAGAGGASGAFAMHYIASAPALSNYIIGAAGAGVSGGAGGNGGLTSFASGSLTASGGGGGAAMAAVAAGTAFCARGGIPNGATNGNITNAKGTAGDPGLIALGALLCSGSGASSPLGGGGAGTNVAGGAAIAAGGYGAGGAGSLSSTVTAAGAAGTQGVIIVYEYA